MFVEKNVIPKCKCKYITKKLMITGYQEVSSQKHRCSQHTSVVSSDVSAQDVLLLQKLLLNTLKDFSRKLFNGFAQESLFHACPY